MKLYELLLESPDIKTLQKNKIALTDEERKKVMDAGATWNHGPNGEETPAVWKGKDKKDNAMPRNFPEQEIVQASLNRLLK